jgi:thioredoxin-like negative regulator of GroEL
MSENKDNLIASVDQWNTAMNMSHQHLVLIKVGLMHGCKPCKTIQPEFEKLTKGLDTNKVRVYLAYVDLDDDLDSVVGIRKVPTFIAVRNGKTFDSYQGTNTAQLGAWINKVTA